MFDLREKVAIVTGAGRGLGKAMALALAEAGADIVCTDVNNESAEKTAEEIRRLNRKALAFKVDITLQEDIEKMAGESVKELKHIDILVNNAGIHIGGEFPPEELDKKYWDKTLDVNLTGTFICSQIIGRQMIKQKAGKIINIASMSGLVVNRLTNRHPLSYCVSKAGVIMLTKVLAVEWAKHNINVNAIAPTYIETAILNPDPEIQKEMVQDIPLGRLGKADDLKGAIVYLASGASDFITGHTLMVDGGYTAW